MKLLKLLSFLNIEFVIIQNTQQPKPEAQTTKL